ncbi:MAG: hypothetical protein ACRC3Z_11185 [Phocaeicola sp.]
MKTQNLVLEGRTPARKSITPVATLKMWLKKENKFFSAQWEERVTNKQVLITCNLALSFVPIMAFGFDTVMPALVAISYFAFSANLVRKEAFNG